MLYPFKKVPFHRGKSPFIDLQLEGIRVDVPEESGNLFITVFHIPKPMSGSTHAYIQNHIHACFNENVLTGVNEKSISVISHCQN